MNTSYFSCIKRLEGGMNILCFSVYGLTNTVMLRVTLEYMLYKIVMQWVRGYLDPRFKL